MYLPSDDPGSGSGTCDKIKDPFASEIPGLVQRGILIPSGKTPHIFAASCTILKDAYIPWRKKHPDLDAGYEEFRRAQREKELDKQRQERESAFQETMVQTAKEALETLAKSANINMTVQAENLNLQAGQVSVTANVTANILGILQETGKDMNASLLRAIFPGGLPQMAPLPGEDPEDFALRRDEAFMEQTKELLPPPPEDQSLQTLDELFREAQQYEDFSRLDREVLESMTPACQVYVKMGVVIQDKLRFMEELTSEGMDFSAQLVFYGKALEQDLKDCFFDLFHSHSSLNDFRTNVFSPDPAKRGEKLTFAQLSSKDQTCIGTYWNLIRTKEKDLAGLCGGAGRKPEERLDEFWWKELSINLQQAGLIRSLADHAGKEAKWNPRNWLRGPARLVDEQIGRFESPGKESMDLMLTLLFGGSVRGGGRDQPIEGVFQRIKQVSALLPVLA